MGDKTDISPDRSNSGTPALEVTDISDNYIISVTDLSAAEFMAPDKISFRTVEAIIHGLYNDQSTTNSTALDILAIYLKGQKILYTESKTLCEMRLIALMLPAILISCISTLLSLQLKNFDWGGSVVSALSAVNAFILAIVSYLKLDAKAESHKIAAYKFDKLQSECEFKSGKILFMKGADSVSKIIDDMESSVKEIKETNQFIIPEYIRHKFHKTYAINVFTLVKKIQVDEMRMINDLKRIINEHLLKSSKPLKTKKDVTELIALELSQHKEINEIIGARKKMLDVDKSFEEEINDSINRGRRHQNFLQFFNT